MLLRFFTNSTSSAYMRGLAEEFGESTNSIRLELNNLSKAGYLLSKEEGRTITYRANVAHPLYNELKMLVHKYLGIDKIIDHVLVRLGEVEAAFIVGDYAEGRDTGTIELVIVGNINKVYLGKLVLKAKDMLRRNVRASIVSEAEYHESSQRFEKALLIWGNIDNKGVVN